MKIDRNQKLITLIISLVLGLVILTSTYIFQDDLVELNPLGIGEILKYALYVVGAIGMLVGLWMLYAYLNEDKLQLTTKHLTVIAIQSALSVLLYYFVKFPLPIFPGFLDIHVSEIPALITSFMYGPFIGSIVIIVRFLIKLPSTITAGVGELADLIMGLTLVIIAGLIYKKNKTLNGALISLGVGSISATVVALFVNYFILIPAYVNIAHIAVEAIVGMCSMIPGITVDNFLIAYTFGGALPFNLFRFVIVSVLTFLLYKRVSGFINKVTN